MKHILSVSEYNNNYPMVVRRSNNYVLFANHDSYKDSLEPDGNYGGDGDILLSRNPDKDGYLLLGGIRVSKDYRNKGLGEFLVIETLKLLKGEENIKGILSSGGSRSELAERMWDRLKKRKDVIVTEGINSLNGRKTYKIELNNETKFNESQVYLDENRQLDIIETYTDCFMELSDLNPYIYVDTFGVDIKDMDEMKSKVDELGTSFGTSELIIKIEGYNRWEKMYQNNESVLREIYEYLKQNIKNDEHRFSKIANVNIENVYTRITVETAGNNYVNSFERDMRHPSIISSSYNGGIMIDYTIDPTNKPKLFLTSGRSIVRKIKSFIHGNEYNFPDIHPKDKITQIEIMHKIKGL